MASWNSNHALSLKKSCENICKCHLFIHLLWNDYNFWNGARKVILSQMEHEPHKHHHVHIIHLFHNYRFLHSPCMFLSVSLFGPSSCTCLSWTWCDGILIATKICVFIVAWLILSLSLSHNLSLAIPLRCSVASYIFSTRKHRNFTVAVVQGKGSEAFHFINHFLFVFNFPEKCDSNESL